MHVYSIHDIVVVHSTVKLPELASFEVPASGVLKPDLTVRLGWVSRRKDGRSSSPSSVTYSEWFGSLGFATRIEVGDPISVIASPPLRFSPHVLYTNIVE